MQSGLPRGAPERFRLPSGLSEAIWPLLLTQNQYGSRHLQALSPRKWENILQTVVDLDLAAEKDAIVSCSKPPDHT